MYEQCKGLKPCLLSWLACSFDLDHIAVAEHTAVADYLSDNQVTVPLIHFSSALCTCEMKCLLLQYFLYISATKSHTIELSVTLGYKHYTVSIQNYIGGVRALNNALIIMYRPQTQYWGGKKKKKSLPEIQGNKEETYHRLK